VRCTCPVFPCAAVPWDECRSIVEISPFHQFTRKKANKRRTLVKSPDFINYPGSSHNPASSLLTLGLHVIWETIVNQRGRPMGSGVE